MKLSERIQNSTESETARFSALVQELTGRGERIINFAIGEPQFDTPAQIITATQKALETGQTKYSPVTGISPLKSKLARQFDDYDADNILITNGAKQSLYSVFQILCDPLDEVIIPRPCWVSFPEQVKLAGGRPVLVDTCNHQLDCDAIAQSIGPQTKAIVINSPNNPTGAVYPKAALEKIAHLALKHDLYVVADEAYNLFVYDDLESESMFQFEQIRDRLIITRSFSKQFNMTGFRIGYIAAARRIISALARLQGHLSGSVCTFAQYGALAALELDAHLPAKWRRNLEAKRDLAYRRATELFDCIKPRGAFYFFPDISKQLKAGMTSLAFATHLLENAGVAVVPGEAFGMAGHIRISFAVCEEDLVSGFTKIAGAL
jgi:aspartate aminotransferase